MLHFILYILVFCFSILCFVCGFQFSRQKWGAIIAGYNNLSEKQKGLIDFSLISKSASKCALAGGIYLLFMDLFLYLILENTRTSSAFLLVLLAIPSILFLLFILKEVRKTNVLYKSIKNN
ncbi:DUF3784 domain-containing protein [Enterococcus sp. AZ196]|uniref:DUF3784 domain-containing protein n=1 Tax=Enterococcus sp. AZ196 TaxID=2774659 RepID=UPI003D28622A